MLSVAEYAGTETEYAETKHTKLKLTTTLCSDMSVSHQTIQRIFMAK